MIITDSPVNLMMVIMDFNYNERDGTRDVWYDLSFTEYKELNTPTANNDRQVDDTTGLKERPGENQDEINKDVKPDQEDNKTEFDNKPSTTPQGIKTGVFVVVAPFVMLSLVLRPILSITTSRKLLVRDVFYCRILLFLMICIISSCPAMSARNFCARNG